MPQSDEHKERRKTMPKLTKEDWVEIYYALEYKLETFPDMDDAWTGHLEDIMEKIGVDGEEAFGKEGT